MCVCDLVIISYSVGEIGHLKLQTENAGQSVLKFGAREIGLPVLK
jgi:hypothetical protein